MPQTLEEKKEANRIACKKYRDKQSSKDITKIRNAKYRLENPDKVKEAHSNWLANNPSYNTIYVKEYRQRNLEKVKAKDRIYSKKYKERQLKENPEEFLKKGCLNRWNKAGIICDDMDGVYNHYLNCNRCEYCDEPFINSKDKCLDHDHSIIDRNNIRGVLCRKCNFLDVLNYLNTDKAVEI